MLICALLIALVILCSYQSARSMSWHRACARFLCVLTLLWAIGVIVVYADSNGSHEPEYFLFAMFGAPALIYICAVILRWIFAPAIMPIPIISLHIIGALLRALFGSALRWSNKFSADFLS